MFFPDRRAGNGGLLVKVSQPGVGADRFNGYEIALDASAQVLRLGRHRQNFELIRDVSCAVRVNDWIPVVARLTANTLEVLVDGRSVIHYEDQERPLKEGQVGLRPWQREVRYRNFWIQRDGQKTGLPFVVAPAEISPMEPGDGAWPATLALQNLPPILFLRRSMLSGPPVAGCDLYA